MKVFLLLGSLLLVGALLLLFVFNRSQPAPPPTAPAQESSREVAPATTSRTAPPARTSVPLPVPQAGSLAGVVWNGMTGEPVAGADVTVSDEGRSSALAHLLTDEKGAFRAAVEGQADIFVRAVGFADRDLLGVGAPGFVEVGLQPEAIVVIRVIDEDGRPVDGPLARGFRKSGLGWVGAQGKPIPEDRGILRWKGLRPGAYRFVAFTRDVPGAVVGEAECSIAPGTVTELMVRCASGADLRGVVVDKADGHPIAGARVQVWSVTWAFEDGGATSADGRFEVGGLDPGVASMVLVSAEGYARVVVRAMPGEETLRVEMDRPMAVTIVVLDETGALLPRAAVAVFDTAVSRAEPLWVGSCGEDGRVAVEGLPAGQLMIAIGSGETGGPRGCRAFFTGGGSDPVEISCGRPEGALAVAVRAGEKPIAGRRVVVADLAGATFEPRPRPDGMLRFIDLGDTFPRSLLRTADTDPSGIARFGGLRRGRHAIQVEGENRGLWLARVGASPGECEVRCDVEPVEGPGAALTGQVLRGGMGLRSARVIFFSRGQMVTGAVTGADGRFEVIVGGLVVDMAVVEIQAETGGSLVTFPLAPNVSDVLLEVR
jgi:hypothetical protein